jgi:hypothetical protein
MAEFKSEIYAIIPQKYYPKTILIKEKTDSNLLKLELEKSSICYPFIVKPEIGLRGLAVKVVHGFQDLSNYHAKANFDYLIQDLIPYENEIGIFYVRFPDQAEGRITGIVGKEYVIVIGDGFSTMIDLIKANPRFELQLKSLQREYGETLNEVLKSGEKRNLVPFGNHSRGAKFIDFSHKITPKLTNVLNEICSQIPEFYFGRIDLMYNTWEELEENRNFLIVELNGAGSEPTHIYDPKHSIFFAWKELARHITYMYQISVANHKRGFPYLSHKEGMKEYRLHLEQSSKIVNF